MNHGDQRGSDIRSVGTEHTMLHWNTTGQKLRPIIVSLYLTYSKFTPSKSLKNIFASTKMINDILLGVKVKKIFYQW